MALSEPVLKLKLHSFPEALCLLHYLHCNIYFPKVVNASQMGKITYPKGSPTHRKSLPDPIKLGGAYIHIVNKMADLTTAYEKRKTALFQSLL